jgi:hypothetical protein
MDFLTLGIISLKEAHQMEWHIGPSHHLSKYNQLTSKQK